MRTSTARIPTIERTGAHSCQGIYFEAKDLRQVERSASLLLERLQMLGLASLAETARWTAADGAQLSVRLNQTALEKGEPNRDTTELSTVFALPARDADKKLAREILLAMLAAPLAYRFPNFEELQAAIRIRTNIVIAGREAMLDFHTTEVNRPLDFWTYRDGSGFVLNEGKSLIDALERALLPRAGSKKYAFSCYRATEYVILLGIARELQASNPKLYAELEARWRIEPIASRAFHDTFLCEHGSMEDPLPFRFYVPGDRVWFRNPDEASSDASGYEGSWVIYLGDGLFTNFWDANRPFTLQSKCVEIYHWRHSLYQDEAGEARIDEAKVRDLVEMSMADEASVALIWDQMARYRDSSGVYQHGGCMDSSREHARRIYPGSADLVLPPIS